MAFGTKTYQVIRQIIQFITIDMMNMQMHTPIFTTLAAMLACPFVAVFDFFANAFPVGGILPFGYATFPSGVILSAHSASQNKRFGECTNRNICFTQSLKNATCTDPEFDSDFFGSAMFINVFGFQPMGIMVCLLGTIMTLNILLPKAVFANPFGWRAAATGAQGRIAFGRIDRFFRRSRT